jgi:predicted naringenin-chalcone synthase
MGCHGAMNAIKLAATIVQAQQTAKVLVCAAELCSLHFQYGWNSSDIVANSLFADGSASLVIEGSTEGRNAIWEIIGFNSHIIPQSEDAMSWSIGDNGFQMKLSSNIANLIVDNLPDWLSDWLQLFGLSPITLNSWAVHPGGPRILEAVESSLSLKADCLGPSREILSRHGNMSSPTVLFIMNLLRQNFGFTGVLGFGPGLTIEALLLNSPSPSDKG